MSLHKPELPTEDPNLVLSRLSITRLINKKKIKKAYQRLLALTNLLESSKLYKAKFDFEMFFLSQISSLEDHQDKVKQLFSDFLQEKRKLAINELQDAKYMQSFANRLLDQVQQIASELTKKSYKRAIELYQLALNFFLQEGLNLANVLAIKMGDLYKDNGDPSCALKSYKSVFFNLLVITTRRIAEQDSDYTEEKIARPTEINQFIQAAKAICSLDEDRHSKELFQVIGNLFSTIDKTPCEQFAHSLIEKTQSSKNYHHYVVVSYIGQYLQLLSSSFKHDTFNGFINWLRNEISIYATIDSKNLNDTDKEKKIKSLISANVNLATPGPSPLHYTPLQYAIANGHPQIANIIIEMGNVDVNEQLLLQNNNTADYNYAHTPLALALLSRPVDLSLVTLLIDRNAEVNVPHNSEATSPLYLAIMTEREKLIKMLLRKGARLKKTETNALSDPAHAGHKLFRKFFSVLSPISSLLKLLAGNNNSPLDSYIPKTPILCPHGMDGYHEFYSPFARAVNMLESNRPVWGIDSPGTLKDKPIPNTIEQMAAAYIDAIRTVQPNGPFILFGWCFGGLVAYEMARQLKAQDKKEVVVLVLFDTLGPIAIQNLNQEEYAKHLLSLAPMFKLLCFEEKEGESKLPTTEQLAAMDKMKQIETMLPIANLTDKKRRRIVEIVRQNLIAEINYNPDIDDNSPFMVCFNSEESIKKYNRWGPDLGWLQQTDNNLLLRANQSASFKRNNKNMVFGDHLVATSVPGADHFSILDIRLMNIIASYICKAQPVVQADYDRRRQFYEYLKSILQKALLSEYQNPQPNPSIGFFGENYNARALQFSTKTPSSNLLLASSGRELNLDITKARPHSSLTSSR